jgi:diacylglycerol kinase family enzyme
MKPPVVLVNGGAGRVRRDPGLVDRIAARLPGGHVQVTRALDEVAPALRALRATGADTLFVVGGDGTTTATLSELVRTWPEGELPRLVLTRGGTINTIPGSLGARGAPDEMLVRYLDAQGDVRESERPLLRIEAEQQPARHGMIFANGAAARWLQIYYEGPSGALAAASLVGRTLLQAPLGGALARRLFEPYEARIELDGELRDAKLTVAGCASIRHVGLGFAPFRTAGQHVDRFHWLQSSASPGELGREIPLFALGVYRKRSCLSHASPRRVRVLTADPEPFTIDGDLFPAARGVEVTAGPAVRFLAP